MEVSRPNTPEPSPEDLENLDKLKAVIERAIADGKLTQSEVKQIRTAAWANGKITPQELELVRTLVKEKLRNGELEWIW
jgi:hypothetical protein